MVKSIGDLLKGVVISERNWPWLIQTKRHQLNCSVWRLESWVWKTNQNKDKPGWRRPAEITVQNQTKVDNEHIPQEFRVQILEADCFVHILSPTGFATSSNCL